MNMRYFRFLYREIDGCFMHFGELTDSKTEDRFTFLYLRGSEGLVNQAQTEHMLFLCPNHVDLVVLGKSDEVTLGVWEKLSAFMTADLLVFAEGASGEVPKAKERICLSPEATYCHQSAQWNFFVKSYKSGSVVMMHGLDVQGDLKKKVEDCVMNVKAVNHQRRCHFQEQPDGFGCALGCILHQDYDVCKYQDNCHETGKMTGVLLLAGTERGDDAERILADVKKCPWNVRFLAVSGETQKEWGAWESAADMDGYRTYYIGTESEVEPDFLDQICRKGFYHVPVVLKEEQGLCCSGLLKYQE